MLLQKVGAEIDLSMALICCQHTYFWRNLAGRMRSIEMSLARRFNAGRKQKRRIPFVALVTVESMFFGRRDATRGDFWLVRSRRWNAGL